MQCSSNIPSAGTSTGGIVDGKAFSTREFREDYDGVHLSQCSDLQIVALIVMLPSSPPFNISTACTTSVL